MNYEKPLTMTTGSIKYLNSELDRLYEFEERVSVVDGKLSNDLLIEIEYEEEILPREAIVEME